MEMTASDALNENNDKLMIVRVDTPGLQYDINALIKAFYPDKDVRVLEPGSPVHDVSVLERPVYMDIRINVPGKNGQKQGAIYVSGREHLYDVDESIGEKNSFKLNLYDLMCSLTERSLPWGNLTGVRPVKIAMTHMAAGESDEEVLRYMKSYHKVSDTKAELALDIAHREARLLAGIDHQNGYSLYIGIPFCPTICLYCSFASNAYSAWKNRIDDYLSALFKEIDFVADEVLPVKGYPDTIYIGGGTPTSLDEEHLDRLLTYINKRLDAGQRAEFTCEAGRPDSITPGKLSVMKRNGVTRISVNPQTMQQKTLDIIGRKTTPEQVESAFYMAREAGFDNINMDIILGLPGEGVTEVGDTLRQIALMNPDSLTVHSLAIKRASALKQRLDEIGIEALKNTEETMNIASETAAALGMKPYYLYRQKNMSGNFENTGYARPGKEGIYNILIMEEVQSIIALGAGAVSKRVDPLSEISITRAENPKDIENYLTRTGEMIERKRKLYGLI